MSQLNIHVNNHSQPYTVSEMRKRLAQVLAPLNGDQIVRFDFQATMDGYEPGETLTVAKIRECLTELKDAEQPPPRGLVVPTVYHGPLARPEND